MKKLILYFLIIGLAFVLVTCNAATGAGEGDDGESDDVIFDWGNPGFRDEPGNSTTNPGVMPTLADCPTITGTLGDISLYGQVIIDARLYASVDDFEADPQVTIAQADGLAWFKILSGGEWEDDELFPQKNNMRVDGETTAVVPSGKTGTPVNVLVQTPIASGVGYIEIRKLTFKKRTSDVALEVIYDNGEYIEIDGNKITFKNSTYSDSGALYRFPDSWGGTETDHSPLAGRTITFTYSIPAHTCNPSGTPAEGASVEHQIHIQAAHNAEDAYNGENDATGQVYVELDNGSGTFTVTADRLIAAAKANNGTGTPFVLNAVRIINNGTTYQSAVRCKSYTLVIESITISP